MEECRDELVEAIVDGIIAQMTFEDMRQMCWDVVYEDVVWLPVDDLVMMAEEYCPEFLGDLKH
jgi:hypothetical protein